MTNENILKAANFLKMNTLKHSYQTWNFDEVIDLMNEARKSERAKVIEEIEKWFAENKDIQTTNSRVMIRILLAQLKGEG